jgi:hypothetical protein
MYIRYLIFCSLFTLTTESYPTAARSESGSPNIVLILTDDQGW